MGMYKCPFCKSTRVVELRHDSDWGGSNSCYRLNSDSEYTEDDPADEFWDIRVKYCLACQLYLNEVEIGWYGNL
jgi:hypothetical protein